MAFTKIAAAGIGSTGTVTLEHVIVTGSVETPVITGAASTANVRANSLVVSGVSTLGSVVATTGTFSGNVSIAGTLTYEDVTNIDSIGVVTARSGVRINSGGLVVTSGVSTLASLQVGTAVTISGGIVTATSFYGDGTNLTNTGSTLSAASGSQRVVLTSQTSGTMTSSATSAALTFNAATGALSATSFSGSLANTLTLNTSGTGLSGSTTFNNSGASTFTVTSNATSANTANAIVARDASGNFSAGTITATLSGTATQVSNTLTLNTSGTGLSGSTTFNGSGASTFTVTSNATSSNTGSTIVARDASGNFSAGTITATLSGSSSQLNGISAVQLYNNMGSIHNTRTSFDASSPSYDFGYRYVQGSTNGPGTGGSQFYSWYIGLGSEYPATGGGSYGAMFAVDRNSATPFLSVRYNESNSFSSWYRVYSGNGARAWVNFNGSTASIRASYNVSSITRNTTGDYTINFSSALPDANYALCGTGEGNSTYAASNIGMVSKYATTAFSSSQVRVLTGEGGTGSAVPRDMSTISISIFR